MIDHDTIHITPAGGNIFEDLGFPGEEAVALHAASTARIAEIIDTKRHLMSEICDWIAERSLNEDAAAKILQTPRSSVSDMLDGKVTAFSVETLVEMLRRVGKEATISVGQGDRPRKEAASDGLFS